MNICAVNNKKCIHVSNFIAMTCVPPLICLVGIFSFAANRLACFPTSSATCSMALWLVNWFNIILTTLSLLCLNIIIPSTIMNFELSSYCVQQQPVIMLGKQVNKTHSCVHSRMQACLAVGRRWSNIPPVYSALVEKSPEKIKKKVICLMVIIHLEGLYLPMWPM